MTLLLQHSCPCITPLAANWSHCLGLDLAGAGPDPQLCTPSSLSDLPWFVPCCNRVLGLCFCSPGLRDCSGSDYRALVTWDADVQTHIACPPPFQGDFCSRPRAPCHCEGRVESVEVGVILPVSLWCWPPLCCWNLSVFHEATSAPPAPPISQGLLLVRTYTLTSAALIRVASIKQHSIS